MAEADDTGMTFSINSREVTISRADVLAATYRQKPGPNDGRVTNHWVVLRREKVPSKWAVRTTLAFLERQGRGNAVATKGHHLGTYQADAILTRLGFRTSQTPRPRGR